MAPTIVLLLLMMMKMMMLSRTISHSEEKSYSIEHQCRKTFCFQLWKPDGVLDVALVTNGQIQRDVSEDKQTKCIKQVYPFTDQEHVCRREPNEFITTGPRGNVTLHCALLSSLTTSHCFMPRSKIVDLLWVAENGNRVKQGPELRVTWISPCDVTLTVSFQSPKNASFRCRARVNGQEWRSPKFGVRLPPPKTGGRRIEIPEPEDGSGGAADGNAAVGPTVGVLSALLLAAAALFALNKRRTRNPQTSRESPTSTANCAVSDSDELVYADVVFLAASERAPADEDTVYADIRCA